MKSQHALNKIILALAVSACIFGLAACDKSPAKASSDPQTSIPVFHANVSPSKPKYVMSAKEEVILNYLLKEDIRTYFEGGDANYSMPDDIVVSNSIQSAKDYEENQVAADLKYFKKRVYVYGMIKSINSGVGNEPYVVMVGENQFQGPQFHFKNVDINKIAELKKGQTTSFMCVGGGAIAGTPMFKDCVLQEDEVDRIAKESFPQYVQFLAEGQDVLKALGQDKARNIFMTTATALTMASLVPDDSPCLKNGGSRNDACQKFVDTIDHSKQLSASEQTIKKLTDSGVIHLAKADPAKQEPAKQEGESLTDGNGTASAAAGTVND